MMPLRHAILHNIDKLSDRLDSLHSKSLVAGHILPCPEPIAQATDNIRSKNDRLKAIIVRRFKSRAELWEIVKIAPKQEMALYSRLHSSDTSGLALEVSSKTGSPYLLSVPLT